MRLSDQQETAVNIITDGRNAIVYAVPGGGKSTLLLELCKRINKRCLILAYNADLAAKMNETLEQNDMKHTVQCFTFHGLCSNCIQLSPDDFSLENSMQLVENGIIEAKKINTDVLLIDEAQDLKSSYVKLVNMVVVQNNIQYFICGDVNQMIYDFDPESCADVNIIRRPRNYFDSEQIWTWTECNTSFRLTPPICNFVNRMFGSNIVSAKLNGEKVVVRAPSAWDIATTIQEFMNPEPNLNMILTATKQHNRPLRSLINSLSESDLPIHLSGHDEGSMCIRKGKMQVSTWHSSKGMENATVFVIVSEECRKNPFYVALTRAFERLIIIMDPKKPNQALCSTCRILSHEIDMDTETKRLVALHSITDVVFPEDTPRPVSSSRLRSIDNWKPRRQIRETYTITNINTTDSDFKFEKTEFQIETSKGTMEDVGKVYYQALKIFLELRYTNHARCVEDCLRPTRMEYDKQIRAIELGHMGRFVTPKLPSNALIPTDVYKLVEEAYYNDNKTVDDYCLMAMASISWHDFHHTLRQMLPTNTWSSQKIFDYLCKRILTLVPEEPNVLFDVRTTKTKNTQLLHLRLHIWSNTYATHIIWSWETSQKDYADAALRAAMHPQNKCLLVNILMGECFTIVCHNPDAVMNMVTIG